MARPRIDDSARQRRRPADLRALILVAAEETFARLGYSDTTTIEVARVAGVSRSVLIRHFATKQELFRAAIEQPLLRFVEEWVPAWTAQLDAPVPNATLMREFVGDLYRNAREHRGAVRILLLHGDQLDPEVRDQVWGALNVGLAALREAGERELAPRGFPTTRVGLTARAVLSLVLGYVALEPALDSLDGTSEDPEVVVDHLAALLLHGFGLGEGQDS
ncbi:TetR/AcrR family transcriptional regulator [Sporichthya polymorpha]|uniref:TetR/AcrR family transcriptional regulator n=1 Tax=Sporichthya polymorpha TaxID=35751 RepID=UPI0003828CEF|nr:TetR/AcrR family transcriptional regulator [Sporichthya polymorpha]